MSDNRFDDPDGAKPSSVPPGGGGADSGAADAVGINEGETGAVQNISSLSDIPGIGTRRADGRGAEASTDAAGDAVTTDRQVSSGGDTEQERRMADPGLVRDDEDAAAAGHNARVSNRDSDVGETVSSRESGDVQHLPRMAQNAPSHDDELRGIVAQTRADLGTDAPESRARDIISQRLNDAGIDHDPGLLDDLARRVVSGD